MLLFALLNALKKNVNNILKALQNKPPLYFKKNKL